MFSKLMYDSVFNHDYNRESFESIRHIRVTYCYSRCMKGDSKTLVFIDGWPMRCPVCNSKQVYHSQVHPKLRKGTETRLKANLLYLSKKNQPKILG